MSESAASGSVEQPGAASAGNLDTQQTDAATGSSASAAKWFDGLSEGNRRIAETKGWVADDKGLDKAFTSFAELERFQGDALRPPKPGAPPEEWKAFEEKLSSKLPEDRRPVASVDKLELKRPEGLPADMPWDTDGETRFKEWAVAAGLSPKQAQGLFEPYAKLQAERLTAWQADVAKKVDGAGELLLREWGAKGSESFGQKQQLAARAIKELGIEDVLKEAMVILPDGVWTSAPAAKAFAQVGEAMFREDSIGGSGTLAKGENPFKPDAKGNRNVTAISALIAKDLPRAKALAIEAGIDPSTNLMFHGHR